MANQTRKTRIIASGVFDLLHLGHVKFLEDAKKAGGKNSELIVIIARDSTVEKMKGKKPIMTENQRRALVEALKSVDKAVVGFEGLDIGEVIEEFKPDIIALGYDQAKMVENVQNYVNKHKLNIKIVRVDKFEEDELSSSSKIKQKIAEKFNR
jgi:FAD synthetase